MTNIQIRDVPEDVATLLKTAANQNGLSLQGFLIGLLQREADKVRQREIVSRWPLVKIADPIDVVALIREQRDEREAHLNAIHNG